MIDEPPESDLTTFDIPPVVECPCGNGHAERKSASITEPYSKDAGERMTSFQYRHEDCPIGGTIVAVEQPLEDGFDYDVVRTLGPLFNPAKYNSLALREGVEAPTNTVLADGGGSD
jgi:hypothetical protein